MPLTLSKPLPSGTEYLLPVVERLAAKHPLVSPYLLLGILHAESNYGLALKPKNPKGSGDFIAREATPERNARMAKQPLPGVVRKVLPDGIKARGKVGPTDAWVPTTNGWGCGLFQLDYESHFDFCASGAWEDPDKAGEYAVAKILLPNRALIAKKHPELNAVALTRAMVASYNAGAGRVLKFMEQKKDIDGCTFHPEYIDKIVNAADSLAGASGAFLGSSSVA
jgi:hypothetical protein